jgi:hypothetical protein
LPNDVSIITNCDENVSLLNNLLSKLTRMFIMPGTSPATRGVFSRQMIGAYPLYKPKVMVSQLSRLAQTLYFKATLRFLLLYDEQLVAEKPSHFIYTPHLERPRDQLN